MVFKYIAVVLALSAAADALTNASTTTKPSTPAQHKNCTNAEMETAKNDTENLKKCIKDIFVNTFNFNSSIKTSVDVPKTEKSSVLCKNISDLENNYLEPVKQSSTCFIKDQNKFSLTVKTLLAMVNTTVNMSSKFKKYHLKCIKESKEQLINAVNDTIGGKDQRMEYLRNNSFDLRFILTLNVNNTHSIDTASFLKKKVNKIFDDNMNCCHLEDLTNKLFDTSINIINESEGSAASFAHLSQNASGAHTPVASLLVLNFTALCLIVMQI